MLFLSKLLVLPFYPVGLVFVLLVLTFFFYKRNMAIYKKTFVLAFIVLLFFSSPIGSRFLLRIFETQYSQLDIYPKCSAVVILGGSTEWPFAPRKYVETNHMGDRIFHGIRTYKQGYAPYLLLTGGRFEFLGYNTGSEAENSMKLIQEISGLDSSCFIIEDQAKNTKEHAPLIETELVKRGLKKEIIIVTTAVHMYRSVKVFEKAGFTVYAAPTDFRAEDNFNWSIISLFPSSHSLSNSRMVLHEIYGVIVYKILGWI